MTDTKDIPAFAAGSPETGGQSGMTLRDYFMGQAVIGLVMSTSQSAAQHAKDAREIVDEMMKQREE